MKLLKIISCSDPMMWYRNKVGDVVPFLGEDPQHYWSREPAGFKNIVNKRDGLIFDVVFDLEKYQIDYLIDVIKNTDCKSFVRTTYDSDMEQAIKERIINNVKEVIHGSAEIYS